MSPAVHPVTLEVVRNALYAVAEEMSVILMRSARSPLLKEAGDLSSALTDEGIALDRIAVQWSADLRYSGQNYELDVPWHDTPEGLRADFEARHRRLYGYATGESIECVNLRVVARVPDVAVELPSRAPADAREPSGEQRAWFVDAGEVTLRRHDRAALPPGRVVDGPALIEDEWSTTLVYPGQRCAADRLGNLLIESGA